MHEDVDDPETHGVKFFSGLLPGIARENRHELSSML